MSDEPNRCKHGKKGIDCVKCYWGVSERYADDDP